MVQDKLIKKLLEYEILKYTKTPQFQFYELNKHHLNTVKSENMNRMTLKYEIRYSSFGFYDLIQHNILNDIIKEVGVCDYITNHNTISSLIEIEDRYVKTHKYIYSGDTIDLLHRMTNYSSMYLSGNTYHYDHIKGNYICLVNGDIYINNIREYHCDYTHTVTIDIYYSDIKVIEIVPENIERKVLLRNQKIDKIKKALR